MIQYCMTSDTNLELNFKRFVYIIKRQRLQ